MADYRVQKLMTSIIALFTATVEEDYADLQSRETFTEVPSQYQLELWGKSPPGSSPITEHSRNKYLLLFLLPLRHVLLQHPRNLGCDFFLLKIAIKFIPFNYTLMKRLNEEK